MARTHGQAGEPPVEAGISNDDTAPQQAVELLRRIIARSRRKREAVGDPASTPAPAPVIAQPAGDQPQPPGQEAPLPDEKQLEQMSARQLGELTWTLHREHPEEQTQLEEVEKVLSEKMGDPNQALGTPDQPAYWARLKLNDGGSAKDIQAWIDKMTAAHFPEDSPQMRGWKMALAQRQQEEQQPAQANAALQNVPTNELQAQLAGVEQLLKGFEEQAEQPGASPDAKAETQKDAEFMQQRVALIEDVLAQRAAGKLPEADPWQHDPDPVGSLPDPRLAREDRGIAEDGKRKAHYAQDLTDPIIDPERGPQPGDAVQGGLTDCWMISAFSALAGTRPELIARAIGPRQGDQCTVTLFVTDKDQKVHPTPVTVDLDFPVQENGGMIYAHAPITNRVLWPAVLEKAIASLGEGGYDDLQLAGIGNRPDQTEAAVLKLLLGDQVSTTSVRTDGKPDGVWQQLVAAEAAREPVTAYASGHVYSVEGVDEATRSVRVRDPTGVDSKALASKDGIQIDKESPDVLIVPEASFVSTFFEIDFHAIKS